MVYHYTVCCESRQSTHKITMQFYFLNSNIGDLHRVCLVSTSTYYSALVVAQCNFIWSILQTWSSYINVLYQNLDILKDHNHQ